MRWQLLRRASFRLGMAEAQFSVGLRAFAQVKVDEPLVGQALLAGHRLEIGDGVFVQTNRDLPLHALRVGFGSESEKS